MKIWFLLLFTLSGCASENSQESEDRDRTERELTRLKWAEVEFKGLAQSEDGQGFIPVSLSTYALRNPDGSQDQPVIQADLTVGLLGGVSFRSVQTNYDFGSKILTARFDDRQGVSGENRQLEWRSRIVDGVVDNIELLTSVGRLKVEAYDGGGGGVERDYSFAIRGIEKSFSAELTIENLRENEPAPPGYTIPLIPKIRAALRFDGTSVLAHIADRAIYDPIRGSLELFYPGAASIVIHKLYLKQKNLNLTTDLKSRELQGEFYKGATKNLSLSLSSIDTSSKESLAKSLYVGSFRNLNLDPVTPWNLSMRLEYLGDIGVNDENLSFRRFPKMKMTIYRCLSTSEKWLARDFYELRSIDFFSNSARFNRLNTSQQGETDLVLKFDQLWQNISGYYSDGGPNSGHKFEFKADAKGYQTTCKK
ncbi:hypothetical protein N9D31_03370 [Oligoflexaceae bacterium]|nr:hypothetical protein [Oligoflexaceae bacterium]